MIGEQLGQSFVKVSTETDGLLQQSQDDPFVQKNIMPVI